MDNGCNLVVRKSERRSCYSWCRRCEKKDVREPMIISDGYESLGPLVADGGSRQLFEVLAECGIDVNYACHLWYT